MTEQQRNRIITLRARGVGYGSIAADVGLSKQSVASFCRRNAVAGIKADNSREYTLSGFCQKCGIPLT